ncbi:hypothetical protein F4808DRAFT_463171 [Astrocystis sublimbata]|nr:hypothetical protein F4808DRAFT_463171 [Astrocystis sublimbata]
MASSSSSSDEFPPIPPAVEATPGSQEPNGILGREEQLAQAPSPSDVSSPQETNAIPGHEEQLSQVLSALGRWVPDSSILKWSWEAFVAAYHPDDPNPDWADDILRHQFLSSKLPAALKFRAIINDYRLSPPGFYETFKDFLIKVIMILFIVRCDRTRDQRHEFDLLASVYLTDEPKNQVVVNIYTYSPGVEEVSDTIARFHGALVGLHQRHRDIDSWDDIAFRWNIDTDTRAWTSTIMCWACEPTPNPIQAGLNRNRLRSMRLGWFSHVDSQPPTPGPDDRAAFLRYWEMRRDDISRFRFEDITHCDPRRMPAHRVAMADVAVADDEMADVAVADDEMADDEMSDEETTDE